MPVQDLGHAVLNVRNIERSLHRAACSLLDLAV